MNVSQPNPDSQHVQLQQQLQLWTQRIDAGSPTAGSYVQRGIAYFGLGAFAQAMADFTEAITLAPNCWQAFEQRSLIYELVNCHNQAIDDLNRVVEIAPSFHQAHLRLGDIHLARQDYSAATAAYTRALLLNSGMWEGYRNRALARFRAGDNAGALLDYSRAIDMEPNRGELFAGRGNVYLVHQNRAAAVEDFQSAMMLYRQVGRAVAAEDVLRWIELPPIDCEV